MACVYKALDVNLNREVAIKFVHEHFASNKDIRERFLREGRTVASLDHPNIMKIFDSSGPNCKNLYVVTEYIKGNSLNQVLKDKRVINEIVVTMIAKEVAMGLEQASVAGVVHRDIKPDNVMICEDGYIKIMDFGIAKDIFSVSATQTNALVGSPPYMSPEQVSGEQIDARTDIYSLGVSMYEAITGKLPFMGNTVHEIILKVMKGNVPRLSKYVRGLDPEIEQVILKCMARDINQRFSNFTELLRVLNRILEKYGIFENRKELRLYFVSPETFERRRRDFLAGTQSKLAASRTGEGAARTLQLDRSKDSAYLDRALSGEIHHKNNQLTGTGVGKKGKTDKLTKVTRIRERKSAIIGRHSGIKSGVQVLHLNDPPPKEHRFRMPVMITVLVGVLLSGSLLIYQVKLRSRSGNTIFLGIKDGIDRLVHRFEGKLLESHNVSIDPKDDSSGLVNESKDKSDTGEAPKHVDSKNDTEAKEEFRRKNTSLPVSSKKAVRNRPNDSYRVSVYKEPVQKRKIEVGPPVKKAPLKIKTPVKESKRVIPAPKYTVVVSFSPPPGEVMVDGHKVGTITGFDVGKMPVKLEKGTHKIWIKKGGKKVDEVVIQLPRDKGQVISLEWKK